MKTLYKILIKPIFVIIASVFVGFFSQFGIILQAILTVLLKTALVYWLWGLLLDTPEFATLGLPHFKFWTVFIMVFIVQLLFPTQQAAQTKPEEKEKEKTRTSPLNMPK